MTKKHFIALAKIVSANTFTMQYPNGDKAKLINATLFIRDLTDYLATQNELFDTYKFEEACKESEPRIIEAV